MRFTPAALVVLGQVTAVLALTLAFARLFARRNAALNISVNLWGLTAALACPAIFAIVAAAEVSWVTLPAPEEAVPAMIAAPSEPVATPPVPEPPAAAPVVIKKDTPLSFEATVTVETPAEPAPAPLPPAPRFRLPEAGTILAAVWAAGALLLAARLLHGFVVQARLRSTLKPAGVDLSAIRESMGLRAAPPVTVSPRVGTPCSIGLLRPVLVLPEAMLSTLTPEALRDILIHECAHVLHRHHWVGLLQRISAIVFWPHPLVHVVNRGLSRRLEELCDNHVLESREAASYARTLLEVLEKSGAVEPVAAGVGLLPPRWKIADRIAGLLDERRRIVTRARVSAALGIGTLLAAAGVALAGIRTADPAAPPIPEPLQAGAPAPDEPLPPGAVLRFGSTKFRHGPGVQMLAFSPDGKTLVAGGNYGMTAWETATGKVRVQRMSCTGHVTFSPDGSLIAAGGGGDSVLLFKTATGEDVTRDGLGKDGTENQGLTGMRPVEFSRDGKQIYSGGREGAVNVFDSATGKLVRTAKGPAKSYLAAVVMADGKPAAISTDGEKKRVLWDLETGTEILKFADVQYPRGVVASPDGSIAAFNCFKVDPAGAHQSQVELWDLGLKKRTLEFEETSSIAFSRDGGTIATGDARGSTIRLREASTGKVLRTIEMGRGAAASLAFSPDGKVLASASSLAVRLWDTATGKELPGSSGHDAPISALAFSPDGKLLATTSSPSPYMQRGMVGGPVDPVRLWDAATARELRALDMAAPADALAFSPDGKRLAAAGGNHVALWETATGKRILSHEGQKEVLRIERGSVPFTSVAFSPDGATLAAGAKDGTLIFWKAATGEKIRSLDGEAITSLAYSPDGKLLALGLTDHTVRLRDASGAREIRNIPIPRNNGGSNSSNGMPTPSSIQVDFSPDGRVLAIEYSGGYGTRTSLWEVATAKEFVKWEQGRNIDPVALTFSPDGRTLASTTMFGGSEVCLWDASSTRKITGFNASPGTVQAGMMRRMMFRNGFPLAFAPDGRGLAVGTDDSTVLLWSVDPSRWPVYIRPRKEERPMEQLWNELASKDAGPAHKAVMEAARQGDRAVAFLKSELTPAGADKAAVRKLIADLDHEQAETRQAASTQLKALDSAAEPMLREALASSPTGELRARLVELLDACESPVTDLPDALRTRRSIWILERIGSSDARSLLSALAQGPAGRLSRDARAALLRLKR